MKPDTTAIARALSIATAIAVFLGLPVLFYLLGDTPRRSAFKEALSIVTLLAFSLMLGQFYLARSNQALLALFEAPAVQKVHKWIAYGAISVILLHPFFIVLPRFFEAGVKPWDAFWTMVTTFDSLGILLGLFAWAVMVAIGLTAFFRMSLMKRFKSRYRGWRAFHAVLTVSFIVAATWHAVDLGRHTDLAMSAMFILLAGVGIGLLARLYRPQHPAFSVKAPTDTTLPQGAK